MSRKASGGSAALCGVLSVPSGRWSTNRITWLAACAPGLTFHFLLFCEAVPTTSPSRTAFRIVANRDRAFPLPITLSIANKRKDYPPTKPRRRRRPNNMLSQKA